MNAELEARAAYKTFVLPFLTRAGWNPSQILAHQANWVRTYVALLLFS